jgi:peptidoglycan-associated lipoprotein
MMPITRTFAALAVVAVASSLANAQSDFGSPLGAGAGVVGSVVTSGLLGTSGGGGVISADGLSGFQGALGAFNGAGSAGVTIPNPAGGFVTVQQGTALNIAGVLGGSAPRERRRALESELGTANAARLVGALSSFGGRQSYGNLVRAVASYNAAVDAIPAGQLPTPALLGVRHALALSSGVTSAPVVDAKVYAEAEAERVRVQEEAQARAVAEAAAREAAATAAAASAARAAALAGARGIIEKQTYFGFDRFDLSAEARADLDAKISLLRANPNLRIRIAGHTDERGSDAYNMALGLRRAAAARRYLVDQGIAANRIETISFGEDRPAVRESNEAAWAKNRRNEFEITAGGESIQLP